MSSPQDILHFWFTELIPKDWFTKNLELDQQIAQRFGAVHRAAVQGELSPWRSDALGRLAEILVLDQFSRNIYRDQPGAFSADGMALILAQEAIGQRCDDALPSASHRSFLYMPFMHSESAVIHEMAVKLFSHPDLAYNLDFEMRHKAIIDRFGRYPHRNAILGRASTSEEEAFLLEPGSSF